MDLSGTTLSHINFKTNNWYVNSLTILLTPLKKRCNQKHQQKINLE